MKCKLKYILVSVVLMFIFSNSVAAKTAEDYKNECVKDGTCQIICSYSQGEDYSFIYHKKSSTSFYTSFSWKGNNKLYELKEEKGNMNISSTALNNLRQGNCPSVVYKDTYSVKQICYENPNEGHCTSIGDKFEDNEKLNMSLIEMSAAEKSTFATSMAVSNLSCIDAKNKILAIDPSLTSENFYEICVYNSDDAAELTSKQFIIVGTKNSFLFYLHYADTVGSGDTVTKLENASEMSIKYSDFYKCKYIPQVYRSFAPSSGLYWWSYKKSAISSDSKFSHACDETYIDDDTNVPIIVGNCEDLLGDELRDTINSVLLYVKIAVPIIIIVLGSVDFGRAILTSNEEEMKKAQKRFFMRLLIGMVIFFIPTFVNALLDIANTVWGISNGTCGLNY